MAPATETASLEQDPRGDRAAAPPIASGDLPSAARDLLAWALVVVLGGIGLVARVLPLTRGTPMLLRQASEDGYLMLTVARNLAIGLGMSTSGGTIPTNGVQPLATLLYAACFRIAHGDKTVGVALVMALSAIVSVLSALAVYRLARIIFAERPRAKQAAAIAAAFWFSSASTIMHSSNALETGIYFLMVALVLARFLSRSADPERDMPAREVLILGGLLGLTFWARNDAVFLVIALGLARVLPTWRSFERARRRVVEAIGLGVMTGLVGAPWMIFNAIHFGSIVPVSGKAESLGAPFGGNLRSVPVRIFEYLSIVVRIPGSHTPTLACTALIILAAVGAVAIYRRGNACTRSAIRVGSIHVVLLSAFYGLYFGASHFMSRYMSPISILCAIFTVGVVIWFPAPRLGRLVRPAAAVAATAVTFGLGIHHYRGGRETHFQVVEWVQQNVPDDVWVGAIQTGTLGFFHDRTLNLDGKTNPSALKARAENRLIEYFFDSPAQYFADWAGLVELRPKLEPRFDMVVYDPKVDLVVFRRRGPSAPASAHLP
jgi:hypothetical protein